MTRPDASPDVLTPGADSMHRVIEVRLRKGPEFARQMWRDSLKTRLRYRRWTVPIAVLEVALSGVLFGLSLPPRIAAIPGLLGIATVVWHVRDRQRWIRQAGMAEAAPEVRLQFSRDGVELETEHVSSSLRWQAFDDVVLGGDGVFLVAAPTSSIYVPYDLLTSRDQAIEIAAMFDHATNSHRDAGAERR